LTVCSLQKGNTGLHRIGSSKQQSGDCTRGPRMFQEEHRHARGSCCGDVCTKHNTAPTQYRRTMGESDEFDNKPRGIAGYRSAPANERRPRRGRWGSRGRRVSSQHQRQPTERDLEGALLVLFEVGEAPPELLLPELENNMECKHQSASNKPTHVWGSIEL